MDEFAEGRARPPGGPSRVNLGHTPPAWVRTGAVFFITVCCEQRNTNQLCQGSVAEGLFCAALHYHRRQDWFLRQMLLMPDHLHALIAPAPDKKIEELVSSWKRYTALTASVVWQKNFFDHRLRSDESWEEKAAYIRANPLRAGLIAENETWEFQIEH